MIFMSAQPDTLYMKWQLEVLLVNLKSLGVKKDQIHILISYDPMHGLSTLFRDLRKRYEEIALFFAYPDTRMDRNYQPSIRPHIIKKHFLQHRRLENETIFYHDADIIFRTLPDFDSLMHDDVWYVSDTTNYISARSIIKNAGRKVLEEMCELIGADQKKIEDASVNSGGAQYLIKNSSYQFWDKVESDSNLLHAFLTENEKRFEAQFVAATKSDAASYVGVIAWCADMWAVLWNAIHANYKVSIAKELDFCWPKDPLQKWDEVKIFHNAGLDTPDASRYFYKGDFFNSTPFNLSFSYVAQDTCSIKYVEAIKEAKEFRKIDLMDVTFLIPVRIDSPERLDNLIISTSFILENFKTNMIVLEADVYRKVPENALSDQIKYVFCTDEVRDLYRTKYNNDMIRMAESPIIALYDVDIIVEPEQLLEAAGHIRSGRAKIALPYDGRFISIDSAAKKQAFLKTLDIGILKSAEEKCTCGSACGGAILLDTAVYKNSGMDNEVFLKWGPEDIERLRRLKILGYPAIRVEGLMYHLYHPPYINSGYRTAEEKIDMLGNYVAMANKTRYEMEEYLMNQKIS